MSRQREEIYGRHILECSFLSRYRLIFTLIDVYNKGIGEDQSVLQKTKCSNFQSNQGFSVGHWRGKEFPKGVPRAENNIKEMDSSFGTPL